MVMVMMMTVVVGVCVLLCLCDVCQCPSQYPLILLESDILVLGEEREWSRGSYPDIHRPIFHTAGVSGLILSHSDINTASFIAFHSKKEIIPSTSHFIIQSFVHPSTHCQST